METPVDAEGEKKRNLLDGRFVSSVCLSGFWSTHSDVTHVSTSSMAISFSSSCSDSCADPFAEAFAPRSALRAGVATRSRSRITTLQRWLW